MFKRLYYWVLHWAHTPYAGIALFAMAFTESSFFPIPPDPLLMAMALGNRRKAFRYATICSLASVLGGVLGFVIGFFLMQSVGTWIIDLFDVWDEFNFMVRVLKDWLVVGVFGAAFTPFPYKVFTIASGVVASQQSDEMWSIFFWFMAASTIGRSGRFFLVAALIKKYGEKIHALIDKYFGLCTLVFGALLIGAFLLIKYLVQWVAAAPG
ncbi:MAG: DedA family protein [Anaerolineaceae bacterium]|nr:DedA family protein [Anaerolineaceae bacterium]